MCLRLRCRVSLAGYDTTTAVCQDSSNVAITAHKCVLTYRSQHSIRSFTHAKNVLNVYLSTDFHRGGVLEYGVHKVHICIGFDIH